MQLRDKDGRYAILKVIPKKHDRSAKAAGWIALSIFVLMASWSVGEKYPAYNTLFVANVFADEIPVSLMEKNEVNRPVILKKIATAESGDSHYCTAAHVRQGCCKKYEIGTPLVCTNKNGTKDVGRYQLNTYFWGETAKKLGLNVYDEEDNQRMAEWIYDHHGTQPWHLSQHNWDK